MFSRKPKKSDDNSDPNNYKLGLLSTADEDVEVKPKHVIPKANGHARGMKDRHKEKHDNGPIEVDEILVAIPGRKRSDNRMSPDATEKIWDDPDGEADVDEPCMSYSDPAETESVIVASPGNGDATKAACFPCWRRSDMLQKKFEELSFAIHYHDVKLMEHILEAESERNQAQLMLMRDSDGLPCLMKAITRQSLNCIHKLLERFQSLSPIFEQYSMDKFKALQTKNKQNLFHLGAEITNDKDIMEAIEKCHLKEHIVDKADCDSTTPLIIACQHRNFAMAERLVTLVDHGAKIDHVDRHGNSPIYLAAATGCAQTLKLFLDKGSSYRKGIWILLSDSTLYKNKGTILQAILESRNPNTLPVCFDEPASYKEHIRNCLKIELKDKPTFFHEVCGTPLINLAKMVVDQNVSVLSQYDNNGMTPIMRATEAGQLDIVKLILGYESGRKTVSLRNDQKPTALLIACARGHHEIAEVIMEKSVINLNDQDGNEKNVFHYAAKFPKVMEVLINVCSKKKEYKDSYRKYLEEQDHKGFVPLHLAASNGSHENVKLLLTTGGVPCDTRRFGSLFGRLSLHYAVCANFKTVQVLVEFVKDSRSREDTQSFIDAVDYKSQTSLHIAASLGRWQTVSYLLKNGATIKEDHEKETPLHHASANGSIRTIKCLLQKDASVINNVNRVGETAAMFAAVLGKTEVLELLFSHGADLLVDGKSRGKYKTCLDWAVVNKKPNTAKAILDMISWEQAMKDSWYGADGLLAKMVEKMPDVALQVLDNCVNDTNNAEKEYDFFPLQTVKGESRKIVTSMQALENMANFSRNECLRHEVVQKFLKEKWQKRAKKWYMFCFFVYTVFLISLTTYIGFVRNNSFSANAPCVFVATGICFVFAILNVIKELIQLFHTKLQYFLHFSAYSEMMMYICVFIFLPHAEKSNRQWQAGAIAVFLGYINFIWFLKRFPALGIYITMTKKILIRFLKVLVPLSFFIMAFAMTFFVLLHDKEGFENIIRAFVTSFAMMVGEVDYREIFLKKTGSNFVLVIIFLVIFLVLMTILLMNLLTGLAVGDTGEILRRSMTERRIQQAMLVVDMDKHLSKYPCLRANVVPKLLVKATTRRTALRKLTRKLKETLHPTLCMSKADDTTTAQSFFCDIKNELEAINARMKAIEDTLNEE